MNIENTNQAQGLQSPSERDYIAKCDCGSTMFHVFCEHAAGAKSQPDGTLIQGKFYELDYDDTVRCQECEGEYKLRDFRNIIEKV